MAKSKAELQRRHAVRRAWDRFQIDLNEQMRRTLINDIRRGKNRKYVEHVDKQSHRVSVWRFIWQGRDVAVVYDRQRKELVTFMPLEWITGGEVDVERELV